jgi:hypothetical protein
MRHAFHPETRLEYREVAEFSAAYIDFPVG